MARGGGLWLSFSMRPQGGSPARPKRTASIGLDAELRKISRHGLIAIYEVGDIPFDIEAAILFFDLVSTRYGRSSNN